MPTMFQLVEITQFPERTIRNYAKQGLLPPVEGGLYSEAHVRVLQAIGRLQMNGIRSIEVLRARLEVMSPEQMQRFIEHDDEEVAPQGAPGAFAPAAPVAAVVEVQTVAPTEPTRQEWERIVLAPGLELHVRRDATDDVRRRAEAIVGT
jgi:DNA-binding transcriptional MerR regulator